MATIICLAPYKFLPAKIGGQKAIASFYKYLGRYHQIVCLTTKNNEHKWAEGYHVVKTFSNSKWRYIDPFNYFKIRKVILKSQASHLLIEHPYMGWLAVFLKKVNGVKLIIRSHNIESLRFKTLGKWWWKVLWQYEKHIHRQADLNFFITEEDRQYAVNHYKLDSAKCIVVTFGTELSGPPSYEEKKLASKLLREKYRFGNQEMILFFTGSFNYQPNKDALQVVQEKIAPALDKENFKYKIIICGPWLDDKRPSHPNIIFAGFVDNIDLYFKGSDVFINPVTDGGGIKTKLVEALAWDTNAISTIEGAFGIDPGICNGKLVLIPSHDWTLFAKAILHADLNKKISNEYYQHFYWGNSTKKAAEMIEQSGLNQLLY